MSSGNFLVGLGLKWGLKSLPVRLAGPIGMAKTAWDAFEAIVTAASKSSAHLQAIQKEDYRFSRLEALCTQSSAKGEYTSDYMYFDLDGYDGAFKILRESGGSLYLISENGGGTYFVWGKTLYLTEQGFKIIARVQKNGNTIQQQDLDAFLTAFVREVADRRDRIQSMQGGGRFGQHMEPMVY